MKISENTNNLILRKYEKASNEKKHQWNKSWLHLIKEKKNNKPRKKQIIHILTLFY